MFLHDKRIALRIPTTLDEKVKRLSKLDGITKSNFIRKLIEERVDLIERYETKPSKNL